MSNRKQVPFGMVPHGILEDPTLTHLDHALSHALLRVAMKRSEIQASNKQLARLVGRKVRSVQAALRRLAAAGWIQVITDGPLGRLQRRIALLWRRDDGPQHISKSLRLPAPCTYATDCAPPGRPPTPPLEEGEKKDDDDMQGNATDRPFEYAPPVEETWPDSDPSVSSSSSDPSPSPEPARKANPDEVAAMLSKAVELWGESPETRQRVITAAKLFRLSWVVRALDVCLARARRESVGFPLLLAVLNNWKREGGPPPPPARLKPAAAPAAAPIVLPVAPEPAEPTAAEVADFRRWATGAKGPALARMGKLALERLGLS